MHNIFLIGLSGSGKSTVGRILAERLHKPFFDIDALIAKEYGMSIPAIFAQRGEDYFRTCESHLLTQVAQTAAGAIIATGAGIVTRSENRLLIREHGLSVYLLVEPETALARLNAQHVSSRVDGKTAEIRPLLANSDPLATLQRLLAERLDWYREADFNCSTQNESAEHVAQQLIARLISAGELDDVPPTTRHIHVGEGYNAVVDWGGLGRLGDYLKHLNLPARVFLITDGNVHDLYASSLVATLTSSGFDPQFYIVPAGEASKSQQQLYAIYDWLLEHRAERREAIIALGGGMIGDLAGYAAATYLRGLPLVQVPTSLLAQVDAAIGGKTGINHPRGKNLIGTFYHPRLVLTDPATLLTLPTRERTEGWAEIVKYGIILDTTLFAQLEEYADALRNFSHLPATLLCEIVARCIALKATVIEEDEREQGRRAILNYGHTVAHALENVLGYGTLLHGEAVALGMVVAAAIAEQAGMFPRAETMRQNALLKALGLPIIYTGPLQAEDILAAIQLDKKVANKQVRWVMPLHIGNVVVTSMPEHIVRPVITAFFAEKRP